MRRFFSSGINAGVLAGMVWGWVCMAANGVTGVFPFEGSFTHNLVTFSAAGAIFGMVTGGILSVAGRFLPFRSAVARGVLVSTALWGLLRFTGLFLSAVEPERFHFAGSALVQGALLAVVLGAMLGLFGRSAFSRA